MSAPTIWSIGHSNHPIDRFLELLRGTGIGLLVDVRSFPASRRFPQFDRAALMASLASAKIDYLWLGASLGGRQTQGGGAALSYDSIAAGAPFAAGLTQLLQRAVHIPTAIMCAERDPLDCHRTVLVGRRLAERGVELRHIHADGTIIPHIEIEDRILQDANLGDDDLLARTIPRPQRLARAWNVRGRAMTGAQ